MEYVVPELQILSKEEEEERERVKKEGLTEFRRMKCFFFFLFSFFFFLFLTKPNQTIVRKGKINRGFPTNCKICLYDFHLSFVVCENCHEPPPQVSFFLYFFFFVSFFSCFLIHHHHHRHHHQQQKGVCLKHVKELCGCGMEKKVLYYRHTNEEFREIVDKCVNSLEVCRKTPEKTGNCDFIIIIIIYYYYYYLLLLLLSLSLSLSLSLFFIFFLTIFFS